MGCGEEGRGKCSGESHASSLRVRSVAQDTAAMRPSQRRTKCCAPASSERLKWARGPPGRCSAVTAAATAVPACDHAPSAHCYGPRAPAGLREPAHAAT